MKQFQTAALFGVALMLTAVGTGARADPNGGQIVIPESSVEEPGDVGKRGHTNVEI
jgi:hypothetical protein